MESERRAVQKRGRKEGRLNPNFFFFDFDVFIFRGILQRRTFFFVVMLRCLKIYRQEEESSVVVRVLPWRKSLPIQQRVCFFLLLRCCVFIFLFLSSAKGLFLYRDLDGLELLE